MNKIYWRFHWRDCPEFSPENANSIGWGIERGADCWRCDGTGEMEEDMVFQECKVCGGTGKNQPRNGYSCCESAEELYNYISTHCGYMPDDNDGIVVVFAGKYIGSGDDGEDLVIPKMNPKPRFLKPSDVWKHFEE